MIKRFKQLHQEQDGTALTEFTICLPIWIVIMIGIANLGTLGVRSTKAQVNAQRALWINAINLTKTDKADNLTRKGGIDYSTMDKSSAAYSETGTLDGIATAHGIAMGAGHWVESGTMTVATELLQSPRLTTTVFLGTGTRGIDHTSRLNKREMPKFMLDDLNTDVFRNQGQGSVSQIISSALAAILTVGGATIPLATAVRYGSVSGASPAEQVSITGMTVTVGAQYDVLVAPKPFKGTGSFSGARGFSLNTRASSLYPMLIGRILAEGESKGHYEGHLRWGKHDWTSQSGSGSYEGLNADFEGAAQEGREQGQECKETVDHNNGVAACQSACSSCQANGGQNCNCDCGSTRAVSQNCQNR
jgi:hypothetical protein